MNEKIELQKLQRMRSIEDTSFFTAYTKLAIGNQDITEDEKFLILKCAIIFINEGENELEKFGYSLILKYANLFHDYLPLYEISMEKGYIPVAKFIEDRFFDISKTEKSFNQLFLSSFKESFKHVRSNKNIYFSFGQKRSYLFSKNEEDFIVVAPTSYGKSELIIHKIEDNLKKRICVVVPTKSLLAQTREKIVKNLLIRDSRNKVITHPDMSYDVSKNFIAILTQERLLRMLQKNSNLNFDIVIIDEAHNLIEYSKKNERDVLTVQCLKILRKRNINTRFHYFTPFLTDPQKIKIFSGKDNLLVDKISEFIKVERYYTYDITAEKKLKLYDQFLNKFFDVPQKNVFDDEFNFIEAHASNKNIIYINRPKKIEEFVNSIENPIEDSSDIKKIKKSLASYLHKDYNLIKGINNGVVYHHGDMPEIVRLYVENAFSKINSIKFIVTTSTLLQGVNIPAQKIFLLNLKKGGENLTSSHFKNLCGRVCRFNEVFNDENKNLEMLEPEIYLIKGKYCDRRANLDKFLIERARENLVIHDEILNPLIKKNLDQLNGEELKKYKDFSEYQENIEMGTSDLEDARIVTSNIAKACFKNNVHDFDIFDNEKQLEENYNNFKDINPISNVDVLILLIESIFLWKIKLKDGYVENFKRLENKDAKQFYSMFLEWRISGKSYNEMINNFLWYWSNKKKDTYVYVGTKWGEITSPYKEGFREVYVDLSKKTESQKVNIAIIKIKEEQDFIDYKLMQYIEVLNDLDLLDEGFYNKIKYGTDNQVMIRMLKEGFSMELTKVIMKSYCEYIDADKDFLKVKREIIDRMKSNGENEILIFEIQYYISN